MALAMLFLRSVRVSMGICGGFYNGAGQSPLPAPLPASPVSVSAGEMISGLRPFGLRTLWEEDRNDSAPPPVRRVPPAGPRPHGSGGRLPRTDPQPPPHGLGHGPDGHPSPPGRNRAQPRGRSGPGPDRGGDGRRGRRFDGWRAGPRPRRPPADLVGDRRAPEGQRPASPRGGQRRSGRDRPRRGNPGRDPSVGKPGGPAHDDGATFSAR